MPQDVGKKTIDIVLKRGYTAAEKEEVEKTTSENEPSRRYKRGGLSDERVEIKKLFLLEIDDSLDIILDKITKQRDCKFLIFC